MSLPAQRRQAGLQGSLESPRRPFPNMAEESIDGQRSNELREHGEGKSSEFLGVWLVDWSACVSVGLYGVAWIWNIKASCLDPSVAPSRAARGDSQQGMKERARPQVLELRSYQQGDWGQKKGPQVSESRSLPKNSGAEAQRENCRERCRM